MYAVLQKPRVEVSRCMCGIVHMQVCAVKDATDEEILAVCNRDNPAGTSHGWSTVCHADDEFWGKVGSVQCEDDAERMHFMVAC